MHNEFRAFFGISAMLGALAMASPPVAHGVPSTNPPVIFNSQLYQQFPDLSFHAGWASFYADASQLTFQIFLDGAFSNFCGAVLLTDSRQVTIEMGTGQFMFVPMCDPVLVPGSDPPVFISCDGLTAGIYYTGGIPLNETLLRELLAGQGEVVILLPARGATNFYWDVPPPLQGRLLQRPGGNNSAALAGLPRAPRSLTALAGVGPVFFPFDDYGPNRAVDVDADGAGDFALHGLTLCTLSIPGDCTTMFSLSCLDTNEILTGGYDLAVVPLGTPIGPAPPPGATWVGSSRRLLTSSNSGSCTRPWGGNLGRWGEGYLGLKLRRPDGDHYGWMRVRLPAGRQPLAPGPYTPNLGSPAGFNPPWPLVGSAGPKSDVVLEPVWAFGPVIEDWACEPTPGTAILAGARPFSLPLSCDGVQRPGHLRMSFPGQVGRAYAVQFKPDLTTGRWTNFGAMLIATSPQAILDLPIAGPGGFYRVLEAD